MTSPPHHTAHGPVPGYVERSRPGYPIPVVRRNPLRLFNPIRLVRAPLSLRNLADRSARYSRLACLSWVSLSVKS
jgi:hypothetical protein